MEAAVGQPDNLLSKGDFVEKALTVNMSQNSRSRTLVQPTGCRRNPARAVSPSVDHIGTHPGEF